MIFGLNIVSSPLAVDVRIEFRIEPHPIKKKRKGWRVVRHTITSPGCWQAGNTIYAHPEIYEKLKREIPKGRLA